MNQTNEINRKSSMTDGEETGKTKARVRNIKQLDHETTNIKVVN